MLCENNDFRRTMNVIIQGYKNAWDVLQEIPNVDWIIDEISSIALESVEAICMEENADNPLFWDTEEDEFGETEQERIINFYRDQYYQTGHVELTNSIELFLNDLKLTYIGYTNNEVDRFISNEVLMNPAQNILFDFNWMGAIIDV